MKVKLIVVRGKPEGKEIPLSGPKFKIGRGETCHLRPNSEQVSREHAEFQITNGVVTVADMGSRNGTLVNGKAVTQGPQVLKNRDLVQVGPLTFAVSIEGAPVAAVAAKAAPTSPAAAQAPLSSPQPQAKSARSAPEDVLNEDIDAWLVGEPTASNPDAPTTVYGGETATIATFKDGAENPAASKPASVPVVAEDQEEDEEEEDEEDDEEEEFEDSLEEEEEEEEEDEDDEDDEDDEEDEESAAVDEFVDESNPFYAAKKAQQQASKAPAASTGGANQQFKDTSDAAGEILRKLMEKRRASR